MLAIPSSIPCKNSTSESAATTGGHDGTAREGEDRMHLQSLAEACGGHQQSAAARDCHSCADAFLCVPCMNMEGMPEEEDLQ